MPEMDGYEATSRIKGLIKQGKLSNVPIVACTADESKMNIEKCIKHSFNLIIFKPVKKTELSQLLQSFNISKKVH